MKFSFIKLGKVIEPRNIRPWWRSHAMAPTAIEHDNHFRVYLGCWDAHGISRIGYVDVSKADPTHVLGISEHPVLDIGIDGAFDENGVFPGHVSKICNVTYLFYTGFQLGQKVRHFNFGGLATSQFQETFKRVSHAPILDRSDEGLMVRAGQSCISGEEQYHSVYSAGSGWTAIGGKMRPSYDVYYQSVKRVDNIEKVGKKIISHDPLIEHGLGRPQIVEYGNRFLVFYTRRLLDMKYYFGIAHSEDLEKWERLDSAIEMPYGDECEFDSDMIYFPSVLHTGGNKFIFFYSGNNFGEEGLGCAQLEIIL